MKKLITVIMLTACSLSYAQGFQTPMQTSANVGKAVISYLVNSPELGLLRIDRISVSGKFAKAQLLDSEDNCSAIAFRVSSNARGEVSVKVNTAAFAVCE